MKSLYAFAAVAAVGCAPALQGTPTETPSVADRPNYASCSIYRTTNLRGGTFEVALPHPTNADTLWIQRGQPATWADGTSATGLEFTVRASEAIDDITTHFTGPLQSGHSESPPSAIPKNSRNLRCTTLLSTIQEITATGIYKLQIYVDNISRGNVLIEREFVVARRPY